jgi:hypothetical protein
MADKKISALTGATTPLAGTEVLPIVQSGATVKVATDDLTVRNLRAAATTGILQVSGPTTGTTRTVTVPDANFTAARTDAAQSFTGDQTISGGTPGLTSGSSQLNIFSTDAISADKGGRISFGGVSGAVGFDPYGFCAIAGLKDNATASNFSGYLTFSTSTSGGTVTERQRISSTGIVTMSAYGAGAATFSAAGVISSVSDETWKIKDGVPVDADSMLMKLKPGYWYYNDEKKQIFGAERQLGFYAQNVNAAIGPEAAPVPETTIETTNDGAEISTTKPWGYYDRSVLAVVVISLQKALVTIESLTERINALESR